MGQERRYSCLNPCFNGRYSQSLSLETWVKKEDTVLILVLMEDTLRDGSEFPSYALKQSLNPCFNGRYSQRLLK